jgi:two-component system response regulator WspF
MARWIGKSGAKCRARDDDRGATCHCLIAIGASAAAALSVVLGGLPRTLPAAIVVVQHLGTSPRAWPSGCSERDARGQVAREGDRPGAGSLVAGSNDA